MTTYGRDGSRILEDRSPIRQSRRRSPSRKRRQHSDDSCPVAAPHGNSREEQQNRENAIAETSVKRFVSFYFTNFSAQLSNFYLRKGFEVCGVLKDSVVPSKRNVHGELYGFVRFSKDRDVGKLLKAVNVVCFGNFRVRAKVARFDRSTVHVGKGELDEKGDGGRGVKGKKGEQKNMEREKEGLGGNVVVKYVGKGEKSVRFEMHGVGGWSLEDVRGGMGSGGEGVVRVGEVVVPVRGGKEKDGETMEVVAEGGGGGRCGKNNGE